MDTMLRSLKGIMGSEVEATDGSLGTAIRFFVDQADWSMPLMMVGGGLATTGELMVPTTLVDQVEKETPRIVLPAMRRSVVSSGKELSGGHHGVFDSLQLMGASVTARGQDVGKVVDLMVDTDRPWLVRYLVVEEGDGSGREHLFSTEWVNKFKVEAKEVDLDVRRGDIRTCPECDLEKGVGREYERQLHEHYDKPVHLARFG
jgi:hypothetical protein